MPCWMRTCRLAVFGFSPTSCKSLSDEDSDLDDVVELGRDAEELWLHGHGEERTRCEPPDVSGLRQRHQSLPLYRPERPYQHKDPTSSGFWNPPCLGLQNQKLLVFWTLLLDASGKVFRRRMSSDSTLRATQLRSRLVCPGLGQVRFLQCIVRIILSKKVPNLTRWTSCFSLAAHAVCIYVLLLRAFES